MPTVFLSYRRADSRDIAGRLFDLLTDELGNGHIFRDVDSIPLGVDFRRVLRDEVACCDVFVAVVGPSWLTVTNASGRRLDDPNDFVRLEVEAALQRGVPVFVALVANAPRPAAGQLPSTLAALADCPALPLRPDPDFGHDVAGLVRALRAAPPAPARPLRPHERWVEVRRRAAWAAGAGALAGGLAGVVQLLTGARDWALVATLLPAMLGGVVLGWRGLGLLGSLAGLLVGCLLGMLLFGAVFLGSLAIIILPATKSPASLRADPSGSDMLAIMVLAASGFTATAAALVGGLTAAARSRRWPLLAGLAGSLAGVGVGIGLGLTVTWTGLQQGELKGLLWVTAPAATAASAGALLGAQSGWRRRQR